jgi:glycosyltransferase involved in cell wall biosynthesis
LTRPTDPPRFSVIVPTHDRPALLAEALSSIRAQSFTDWECIVVDDGNLEPVEVPNDPRIRVMRRTTNGGPAAARNFGLDAATGTYVAFLDDDDMWTPERLADAAAAHDDAVVVVCWQGILGVERHKGHGRVLTGDVRDVILDDMTPHLGATSIARHAAPRFDERYHASDDLEWWLRVATRERVRTVPRIGLLYRYHDQVRNHTSQSRRIDEAQRLLEEQAPYFATHRTARAFRYKRMGLAAMATGDHHRAHRFFLTSLRYRPRPRTVWHLLRSCRSPRPAGASAASGETGVAMHARAWTTTPRWQTRPEAQETWRTPSPPTAAPSSSTSASRPAPPRR